MEIVGIELLNVVGVYAEYNGFKFVPVVAEVRSDGFSTRIPFPEKPQPVAAPCDSNFYGDPNALFVRSVIPSVFEYTPTHAPDGRSTVIDQVFLAFAPDSTTQPTPFICSSNELFAASLIFHSDKSTEATEVACAFWQLLLEHRLSLNEFDITGIDYSHPFGHMTSVDIGFRDGWYYFRDNHPPPEHIQREFENPD